MSKGALPIVAFCLLAAACGGDGDTAATSALVQVPDVVGQSMGFARGALGALGLVADVIETDSGGLAGQVAEQVPAAGIEVAPGSSVVIKVPASTTTTTTTTVAESTTTTADPAVGIALA